MWVVNSFFGMQSMKKFIWIKESFVDLTKFSLIQRNHFLGRILKKQFSQCKEILRACDTWEK